MTDFGVVVARSFTESLPGAAVITASSSAVSGIILYSSPAHHRVVIGFALLGHRHRLRCVINQQRIEPEIRHVCMGKRVG
jgi:hypothetical protein